MKKRESRWEGKDINVFYTTVTEYGVLYHIPLIALYDLALELGIGSEEAIHNKISKLKEFYS